MRLGPQLAFALSYIIAPVWPRASTFLSKRTLASSHERTLNAVTYCHFPSTLDGSRVSQRDADDTGKFLKGRLASTEPQTQDDQKMSHGLESPG